MRIAVIGSGNVGRTLARLWAAAGHEVVIGSRDPTSAASVAAAQAAGADVATQAEAVARSEAVLLAVPSDTAVDTLAGLGPLAGKVIIDATNDFAHLDSSNAEVLQRAAPGAAVVKAFNVVGVEAMERAADGESRATLPLAGNDERAVAIASDLARDVGFEPLHVGGLAQAASLERLASVWIAWSRTLGRRFLWQIDV